MARARKRNPNITVTGWIILVVGVFSLFMGIIGGGSEFWRGAACGVGVVAIILGLNYLLAKPSR